MILSIEELSDDWGLRSLKKIVTKIQTGTTPPSKIERYYNGNIQWFRPEDIGQEKYLNVSSRTITEEAVKDKKARIFDANTLMITCIGNIGRVGILSNTASSNQQITGIKVNEEICKTDYLYWWFQFIRPRLQKVSPGGIIKILNQNNLLSIPIPLPYPDDPARSFAEQRRIVARLESLLGEVKAMREQVQILQRDLNHLMESALAEVFPSVGQPLPQGWGWMSLEEVAPEDSQQIFPLNYPEQEFNYWGLDAIEKNQFDEPQSNFVPGSSIQSTCIKFDSQHVLYCKLRPYLNKVIVPSISGIGSTEWVPLKPAPNILDRKYLAYFLRSPQFLSYSTKNVAGARMPRMSKKALKETSVQMPFVNNPPRSLAEQRRIVAYLDGIQQTVREAQELIQTDLRAIEQLEQSILAAAFRGEL